MRYWVKENIVRELIQNSIDACKTMEESAAKMEKFRYQNYQPYISVILDKDRKKLWLWTMVVVCL